MLFKRCSASAAALVAASLLTPVASAQFDKQGPDTPVTPDVVLPDGSGRTYSIELVPITPDELAELADAGKSIDIDQATGMRIVETFRDSLPPDWGRAGGDIGGLALDSYGNPIVNTLPGMPDWAQWNVDALRKNIADHALHIRNLRLAIDKRADEITLTSGRHTPAEYRRSDLDLRTDLFESRHDLGNLLGQAFERRIDVGDVVELDDRTLLTNDVIDSAARTVAWIEAYRATHLESGELIPVALGDEALRTLAAGGYTPDTLASINLNASQVSNDPELRGIIPILFCYSRSSIPVGWTQLSGDIDLWNGTTTPADDDSADVPLYGNFYFFTCSDADENTNVRVGTNGYVSFFEQGGGALDGTDFSNDPLPDVNDPDGFVAGWWDDLEVKPQGSIDRISRLTEGASPNRVTTIQYFSVSNHNGSGAEFYRFQIKFFEQTQNIEVHYDTTWASDAADSATTGIENYAGGIGSSCGFDCTNAYASTPPNNWRWQPFFRPSNDSASNPACILPNGSAVGSTLGATGSDVSSCTFNDFADVWYVFHPTANGNVTITTCSSTTDFDTSLAVFENGSGGAEVACDDDDPSGGDCILASTGLSRKSTVTFAASTANTYYVRVAGFSGTRGRFGLSVTGGGAAPGSSSRDDCPIAYDMGTNLFDSGFTTNNSGCEDDTSCGNADYIDEWNVWTSPSYPTSVLVSLGGSDFNTTLAIFDGCPENAGNEITCNDDFLFSLQSLALFDAQPNTQYWIRIAGAGGAVGNWDLELQPTPKNDDCADAIVLGPDGTQTGNLTFATNDGTATCGTSTTNPDVWYAFTAPCDGTVTFDTCGTHDAPGTDLGMDTVLTLFDACGGAQLACNDDDTSGQCPQMGAGRDSRITWSINDGQTVILRVSHFNAAIANGAFVLHHDFSPTNDQCQDAITVASGSHLFCNIGADTDGAPNALCQRFASNDVVADVWYRYVVPCNGRVSVSTCNTANYDTRIAIYAGDGCANLNSRLVACIDDSSGCGLTTTARANALAGTVLTIRIGGYNGSQGEGTFSINCTPGCHCDWNSDGFKNDTDFFDFVNDFFGGTGPQGNFDFNLDGFQNNQDWFDFTNCFFNPIPGC